MSFFFLYWNKSQCFAATCTSSNRYFGFNQDLPLARITVLTLAVAQIISACLSTLSLAAQLNMSMPIWKELNISQQKKAYFQLLQRIRMYHVPDALQSELLLWCCQGKGHAQTAGWKNIKVECAGRGQCTIMLSLVWYVHHFGKVCSRIDVY